jgi:rhodanese-related sulfurtransferase
MSAVDRLLQRARATLGVRPGPSELAGVIGAGALVVDIRPAAFRADEGALPGAVVLERNVLEWRLDPASDARIPETAYDREVVVLCSEGYTSSLAAATLHQLGLARATDVVGGFLAWCDAGLPTVPGGTPAGERSRS